MFSYSKHQQGTYLASDENRNDDLAATVRVACDVARELVHVWHEDGLLASGCCTADTLTELNLLAGGLSVEGAQEEVLVL